MHINALGAHMSLALNYKYTFTISIVKSRLDFFHKMYQLLSAI